MFLRIARVCLTVALLSFACTLNCFAADEAPKAKLSPTDILIKMDEQNSGYTDQLMDVTITIKDTDGSEKKYDMVVAQYGKHKRLVRFTSGEVKGMASLIESRNRMYIYLPGFKKVRRVASHNMNQSFAGSDFTNDDMASTYWSDSYDVTFDKEDEGFYYLKGVPKPDSKLKYSYVTIKIGKKDFHQAGTKYYNKKGELVKDFIAWEMKEFPGGAKRCRFVKMTDPRTGHSSVMETTMLKVNQKLKKSMFTVRQLQWGR